MQDDRRQSGLILQFKKKLKFYVAGVSGHQGKDPQLDCYEKCYTL